VSVEQVLRDALINDANVNALLAGRIYPLVVPQDAQLPAVAYQKISGIRQYVQDGVRKPEVSLIQLTCLSKTYNEAKQVEEVIRNALDGKKINDLIVFVQNRRDDYTRDGEINVVRIDLRVYYG
jgi:hypothetical protein